MPTVTITISDEIKKELQKFSWINWSEVAREEVIKREKRLEELKKIEKILSKSKFTEKDAEELSEKVKLAMHKKLKDEGLI
jgi:predicted CopG family antitoxin